MQILLGVSATFSLWQMTFYYTVAIRIIHDFLYKNSHFQIKKSHYSVFVKLSLLMYLMQNSSRAITIFWDVTKSSEKQTQPELFWLFKSMWNSIPNIFTANISVTPYVDIIGSKLLGISNFNIFLIYISPSATVGYFLKTKGKILKTFMEIIELKKFNRSWNVNNNIFYLINYLWYK